MNRVMIQGGKELRGKVSVSGGKNAVLPLISASLLATSGETRLTNVPSLSDVIAMGRIAKELGVTVETGDSQMVLSAEQINQTHTTSKLVTEIRASVFLLGPLLARLGHVCIPHPGGCKIGSRPIDLHIQGLEKMGVTFNINKDYIEGRIANRLQGANIHLSFPSVGATINLITAAVLAEGETLIQNVAQDPEIEDLICFLKKMGANITKINDEKKANILIQGVDELHAVKHTVMPDRIEAGTYLLAAVATKGSVFVEGAVADHLTIFLEILKNMGVQVGVHKNGISVDASRPLQPVNIETRSYPGFPTDLKDALLIAFLNANGISLITEGIYPERFTNVNALKKMGADISVIGSTAIIQGGKPLVGTSVKANDMRAGISLTLAGLMAEGYTTISQAHYILRGYENVIGKFRGIGADIRPIQRHLSIGRNRSTVYPLKWDSIGPPQFPLRDL